MTPQMFPMPPTMTMTSTIIGDLEGEARREDAVDERPVDGAGEPAEDGADGVGPELRPHERDSHGRRGDLVLAHRDPGSAHLRVAQAEFTKT